MSSLRRRPSDAGRSGGAATDRTPAQTYTAVDGSPRLTLQFEGLRLGPRDAKVSQGFAARDEDYPCGPERGVARLSLRALRCRASDGARFCNAMPASGPPSGCGATRTNNSATLVPTTAFTRMKPAR